MLVCYLWLCITQFWFVSLQLGRMISEDTVFLDIPKFITGMGAEEFSDDIFEDITGSAS